MKSLSDILSPLQNHVEIMKLLENQSPEGSRKLLLEELAKQPQKSSKQTWLSRFWTASGSSANSIHDVLVDLARYYPCDTKCCITHENVDFESPDSYIPIAQGHVFEKAALCEWLKLEFKNPYTGLPFLIDDALYLKKIFPEIKTQENKNEESPVFLNPIFGQPRTMPVIAVVRHHRDQTRARTFHVSTGIEKQKTVVLKQSRSNP